MLSGYLDDPFPAFWSADHPAQRGKLFFREIPGSHPVGGHHEVLDNIPGAVLLGYNQILYRIAVKYGTRFNRLKIQGPMQMPEGLQTLGYLDPASRRF